MNQKCKKCNGMGITIHGGVCNICKGAGFIRSKCSKINCNGKDNCTNNPDKCNTFKRMKGSK